MMIGALDSITEYKCLSVSLGDIQTQTQKSTLRPTFVHKHRQIYIYTGISNTYILLYYYIIIILTCIEG